MMRHGPRRVAGPRTREVVSDPFPDASVVLGLVGDPTGGYDVQVQNRAGMPHEEVADLLMMAAKRLTGSDDRSRGLF